MKKEYILKLKLLQKSNEIHGVFKEASQALYSNNKPISMCIIIAKVGTIGRKEKTERAWGKGIQFSAVILHNDEGGGGKRKMRGRR